MVAPTIRARFVLNDNGEPKAIERDNHKHYRIQLQIVNAPQDTYAVTYKLHHTYYDPIREVRDRESGFAESLTSYGDYTIQASLRGRKAVETIAIPLSVALEGGHEGSTQQIATALKNIREN